MGMLHLLETPAAAAAWLAERVRGQLTVDSRQVRAGDGFIAWPGAATDGRRYVQAALAAGAAACLVEAEGADAFALDDPRVAHYRGLKAALGPIAAAYYRQPSERLDVLAVTGTNGKTSTAWWLAQALSTVKALQSETLLNAEQQSTAVCGLVGTLGVGVPPNVVFNGLTTPDPVLLQRSFREFADAGFFACAIEASSIGLAERRLDGTRIRVALFTNFTQDHLDYHGSMQAYWHAKAALFDWPLLQAAVINIDDAQGAALAHSLQGRTEVRALDVWTCSCTSAARLQASAIRYTDAGVVFDVTEGGERHPLATRVVGDYNVANLLGVIAAMRALGVPLAACVQVCAQLTPVPGRMECISESGQPLIAVDYAHTPDALDKALGALRPVATERKGQLWCLFGCGGDRDASKRPLMAAVAERGADQIVVTSDNPRREKPEIIISQILLGLSHRNTVHVQPDRAAAIASTIADMQDADVLLIAGKGHEDYQEVQGIKRPFLDAAHARSALALRMQSTQSMQRVQGVAA